MVSTAKGALALVRKRGVLTLTPEPGFVSLIEAVVGGPIKGSWWGHEQGGLIFQIASALEDSPDVLAAKLVGGKVAFVHRALWPALLRVMTDPAHRQQATAGLSDAAGRLLGDVEKSGSMRGSDKKVRTELEKRALVVSASEHTDRGNHVTVLRSWRAWAPREIADEAAALPLADAKRRLARAGLSWE
jgi:hypothetical protein